MKKEGAEERRVEVRQGECVLQAWLFAKCSTMKYQHGESGVSPIFRKRNLRLKDLINTLFPMSHS